MKKRAFFAAVFCCVLITSPVRAMNVKIFDGKIADFVDVEMVEEGRVLYKYAELLGYFCEIKPFSGFAVLSKGGKAEALPVDRKSLTVSLEFFYQKGVTTIWANTARIWDAEIFVKNHGWTRLGFVAHAAGGARGFFAETNSAELMLESYKKGFRVYEMDFNTTSDGFLAAVHDWESYGKVMSREEWLSSKIWGTLTPMMLEDVFEFMMWTKNTFLILDTKSFEYDDEKIKEQFNILVQTAKKIDANLLKRVVPQIYSQKHYDIYMNIYPFDSIIYTLYATDESEESIVEFVGKKENVRVVTMPPERCKEEFRNKIIEKGKLIYLHTLNEEEEVEYWRKNGVYGFYTDFLDFPK